MSVREIIDSWNSYNFKMTPFEEAELGRKIMKGVFNENPPWTTESLAADAKRVRKITVGFLVRAGSCWIGIHYSKNTKRLCINVIPFVTFWIVFKGGMRP